MRGGRESTLPGTLRPHHLHGHIDGRKLRYDNAGQLSSWRNMPTSPTVTDSFLYDGEGNRVEQVVTSGGTTTTTTYVGALEELATPGATTTTTASYGGLALSVNGTLACTLSDDLGSVSVALAADGSVRRRLSAARGAMRNCARLMRSRSAWPGAEFCTRQRCAPPDQSGMPEQPRPRPSRPRHSPAR